MIGGMIIDDKGNVVTLVHYAHSIEGGHVVIACMPSGQGINQFVYTGEPDPVNCPLCQNTEAHRRAKQAQENTRTK